MTLKRMVLSNADISRLVDGVRLGDKESSDRLVEIFKPLIQKTCYTLYTRLMKTVPLFELLQDATNVTLYLVAVEYKKQDEPGFIAHLPRFIQTQLPARLTQYYRPLSVYRGHADQLFDNLEVIDDVHPLQTLIEEDIVTIVKELNDFMWDNFNQRELDIIINSVIKNETRASIAIRCKVSAMRIQHIYDECMRKLFRFMKMKGYNRVDDIL